MVDLCAARPIHLAIVEGVKTMTGGEGPWIREELTVRRARRDRGGLEPRDHRRRVHGADGFRPMADRGTPPFEVCDSTLKLAEEAGLGTRDLKRIEVIGPREVASDFAGAREKRRTAPRVRMGIRG